MIYIWYSEPHKCQAGDLIDYRAAFREPDWQQRVYVDEYIAFYGDETLPKPGECFEVTFE